MIKELEE